jgi:hypothetical protein
MDAEYQACRATARKGLSFIKLMREFALLSRDLEVGGDLHMSCDKQAALCLCKDRRESKRVKHIDSIYHFAGAHLAHGELALLY